MPGKRFARLTVISEAGRDRYRHKLYRCMCDCGMAKTIPGTDLRSGNTRSCGCLYKEHASALGKSSVRHGDSKSREYFSWRAMKQRCLDPNTMSYSNYGGRGIKVCERWMKYENFLADMGRRPSPEHSLDRIDGKGNYEATNCRWATSAEQHRNLRTNVKLTWNGETLTVSDWARKTGLSLTAILTRLKRGWSTENTLTIPSRKVSKQGDA